MTDATFASSAGAVPSFVTDAEASHAGAIAQIQCEALDGTLAAAGVQGRTDPEAVKNAWSSTLSRPSASGYGTMVAIGEAGVVGYVSFFPVPGETDTFEIGDLQVHSDFRRQGHGSRLLQAATDLNQNSKRVEVWLTPTDETSIRFFQGAGFAPAGKKRQLDVPSGNLEQHLWYTTLK